MTDVLLQTRGVCVNFGGLAALTNFDLEIQQGSIIGLIGPNGAGKTTVFNAITGIVIPRRGSILFKGQEIKGWTPTQVARFGIARTFQNIRLYDDLSVVENVMVAGHASIGYTVFEAVFGIGRFWKKERQLRQEAYRLLEATGLADVAHWKAGELPYGNQRKVEMARALALKPSLILLDEPVAGMNPRETIEFGELLLRLHQELQLTVCLIEHDMSFVMDVCHYLQVLDHGIPIAWGTPEEVRSNPAVITAYLGAT